MKARVGQGRGGLRLCGWLPQGADVGTRIMGSASAATAAGVPACALASGLFIRPLHPARFAGMTCVPVLLPVCYHHRRRLMVESGGGRLLRAVGRKAHGMRGAHWCSNLAYWV